MKHQYLLGLIWLLVSFSTGGWTQQLEVKNDFFYIDGQKIFVKSIGYESSALPGEVPWEKTFNPEQMHFDIQRILSGGFNTIRTWAPFTAEELDLLLAYDIKIIMGIWVDPHADFSNEAFVDEAKAIVSDVLSYSKNYDNIIAYLIMNEPLPETIFNAGYDHTVDLWNELINIIHINHPGRPVSISNTCNGTYIEPEIFDFSAYNVYIYNPVTVNYLHGYRDFIHYLLQLKAPGQPLIITEYGLSVSPGGPGNWGYGGNSLTEQQEGILHMYKSLVDGGASGSCVFNYSDGWWKGGNEFVHDDVAEEWFGLVEYSSLTDTQGQERPVWEAVKMYQSAVITQPKSSEIYTNQVPVEVFVNDTVDRIDILMENNLIKSEEKNILVTGMEVTLPSIQISTNDDFWQTDTVEVTYLINKSATFTTGSTIEYIFYPHIGFEYGEKYQISMPAGEQVSITREHIINTSKNVFTLGAAFDIHYNNFQKRIVNQLTFSRIDTLANSINDHFSATTSIDIYPNPAKNYFTVACNRTQTPHFALKIFNAAGILVRHIQKQMWDEPINISNLKPGMYHILITMNNHAPPCMKKLILF